MSEFRINATKTQARKVWVSFGACRIILPFFDPIEQLRLQILNRFAYKILVSRVQSKLPLTPYNPIFNEQGMIYVYNPKSLTFDRVAYPNSVFYLSIQNMEDLYGLN